ncbi:amidase [Cyberlindnera jadinii NRRL Y-1542]|uniref:amidase n=1 Tax=Cyberlindnera jadinii (strain ATCC 18201 / CBS 1600 / BCRC 20928 / JCM 3617 / NBRC 0987 / NRRL Y-1542) TaxID=983966 RepID=A0A1E4S544_CYBJN|nr:amidase [Cyberlindnera jadinii NRRL Y-1542]ODV74628.1 amidase [Cyberlindnera jadinii NRRL Y-1542]
MTTAQVFFDHRTEKLTSEETHYKGDPERYEKEWVPLIKAYNKAREDAIPKEYLAPKGLLPEGDLDYAPFDATTVPAKVLDPKSLAITELTAVEIAKKIKAKELTAVQTITAFIKRATIAHQLTNCAMEVLFEEGLKRAQELDSYYETTGELVGPLHGVPVSLKEHYNYAGRVTTCSFVACLTNITPEFSLTNQILYDLGAVFYIRTTEPQCLMHLDSENNITGRARNAHKLSMSPGGSSSGEGALIAMKGSPLGVGSDIGGSIRSPCAFNGIWGMKPSNKRVSMKDVMMAPTDTCNEMIVCSLGPMANSPEDLDLFMKSYLSKKPWNEDATCMPIEWRTVPTPKPSELTIGICYDDGVVKPHPPVLRALKEVEKKLRAVGINVVSWEPHRVYEAVEVAFASYTADGNYTAINRLAASGEPVVPLTDHYLQMGKGDKGLSTLEQHFYTNTREALRQEYLDLFNKRGVNFVLAPTYVGVAPKPSTIKYWGYTALWNILDYTCVTFPSGISASKELDPAEDIEPRNEYEAYEYGLYNAEDADGLPVGLTLVGRRYTEEETLKASTVIRDALKA